MGCPVVPVGLAQAAVGASALGGQATVARDCATAGRADGRPGDCASGWLGLALRFGRGGRTAGQKPLVRHGCGIQPPCRRALRCPASRPPPSPSAPLARPALRLPRRPTAPPPPSLAPLPSPPRRRLAPPYAGPDLPLLLPLAIYRQIHPPPTAPPRPFATDRNRPPAPWREDPPAEGQPPPDPPGRGETPAPPVA